MALHCQICSDQVYLTHNIAELYYSSNNTMDISQELLHGCTSLLKHRSEEFMVSSFESISNKGHGLFFSIPI